jgi:negative regulator of replication initiation
MSGFALAQHKKSCRKNFNWHKNFASKKRSVERFLMVLEQAQCLTTGAFDFSSEEATAGAGAASSSVSGTG